MRELILELPITLTDVNTKKDIFEVSNHHSNICKINTISDMFNSDSDDDDYYKNKLNQEIEEYKEIIQNMENEILELKAIKNIVKNKGSIKTPVNYENSKCWWDRHDIHDDSLGMPCEIKNGKLKTKGCFCSPNCMLAYNIAYMRDDKMNERTMLIKNIYGDIKTAPPWQSLQDYGGYLSIDEFRDNFSDIYRNIELFEEDIEPINIYIEESVNNVSKNTRDYVLKRSKPPIYNY